MTIHKLPSPQRPIPEDQPHVRIFPETAIGGWPVEYAGAPQTRGRENRVCPTRSAAVAHAVDLHERYGVTIVDWSRSKRAGAAWA